MSQWDELQTPQVKLRRRSSIFNIVLPEKFVETENDSVKYQLSLKQESLDWVHLLKNQNRKLKLTKNLKYEEDRSLLEEHHIIYLENRIIHAELAAEITKINDKVFSYIKRKEYLIKKHNFYSELLDEKMMDCALEILPQAF